jgi:hypothetical protein
MESGCGSFVYKCGIRGGTSEDRHSHAWLEQDGVVLDITADQFGDADEVVVTTDRTWHDQSEEVETFPADFDRWDDHTRVEFGAAYRRIVGGGIDVPA